MATGKRMTFEQQRALREQQKREAQASGEADANLGGERAASGGARSERAASGGGRRFGRTADSEQRPGRTARSAHSTRSTRSTRSARAADSDRSARSSRSSRTSGVTRRPSRTASGASRPSRATSGSTRSARTENDELAREGASGVTRPAREGATGARATREGASGNLRTSGRSASGRSASGRTASGRSTGSQARDSLAAIGESGRERLSHLSEGSDAAVANRPPLTKIALVVVLVLVLIFALKMCTSVMPINVTVNGTSYELRGAKTVQTAIEASGLPINPGDYISLNGNVLEKSKGHPFLADVNGEKTANPNYHLRDGDKVNVTDGEDIVEEYDSVEEDLPFSVQIVGIGAIHKFEEGTNGVLEIRTGKVSGETVEKQKTAPEDTLCSEYNVDAGNDKVVAFTFDDGPSSTYTAAILDILKENDAKATFFVVGTEVKEYPDMVKREHEEGHQVCTHTYDHADPAGGTNIGFMDADGQVNEIVRGNETITDVIGGEASRVVRLPGGNLDPTVVENLLPYVDYEIGWNVDTEDWTLPGVDAIYNAMISAKPGDVVLCHDSGGERDETVEALKRALPYLKSQGFSFVTIDELLEYPVASG